MTSSDSPTGGNPLRCRPALAMLLAAAALVWLAGSWFAGVAGCAPLLTSPDATVLLLLLAVTPVLEEYLLRQAVHQPLIDALPGRPGFRCLVAAAVFAGLHLGRGLLMPVQVFVPALLNGWLFERTRRWQLCAAVHALANAGALLACSH